MNSFLSKINDKADETLLDMLIRYKGSTKIVRTKRYNKPPRMRGYILPDKLEVYLDEGVRIPLRIASNPAIAIRGNRALLYIRVASVGGDFNITSIVHITIPIEELKGKMKLKAKELLYPILPCENVEDPRINPVDYQELYHVRGFDLSKGAVITFKANLSEDNAKVRLIELVRFRTRNREEFILRDYRDTFPLNNKNMIVRPFIRSMGIGSIFIGPRNGAIVSFEELKPIPELLPQKDEIKIGGNAAAKISSNEYLLIYHSVDEYGVYYTYAAVFSNDGELLSMTKEPIIIPNPREYIGRRPGTVFICGVAKYKDEIIITAGKDYEVVIIYSINEDDLFEKLCRS